ncbi:MAG: HAMP domain-containing protein [Alphaproteobacteria bacterium]|nr:HAMP domain-containing protein [Alphaproteobacteria bacterium]
MDARVQTETAKPKAAFVPHLPRSLAFRLALLYGMVFAISATALIGLVYFTTTASLTRQRDRAITVELEELKSELGAAGGGIGEVERQITVRDTAPDKSQYIYALYDKFGHLLAGSEAKLPRADAWIDVASRTDDGVPHTTHFRTSLLPEGYLLGVGEDTEQFDDLHTFLRAALLIGLAAAFAIALAGGWALSWTFRQRLDRVAAVCGEIMEGRLGSRIPVRATGDEIDLLSRSVNSMLDRIVGLMDTLRQISVDVAHDLRTPLARLRQGLESTKFKAKTTDDYAAAVDKAIGEADTILDTFTALLRIAELEAGTRRAAFTPVDLSRLFETVADAYAPPAEENGQRIVARIEQGVSVTGDANLLTQMIANFVANALRHSPSGTTVTVELSGGAHPLGVVSDNGPGIPEADRARVFQRFVRLESSRTTPGSGLGLSLCAAIAELHGIRLDLKDNHPGLRCEVRF